MNTTFKGLFEAVEQKTLNADLLKRRGLIKE